MGKTSSKELIKSLKMKEKEQLKINVTFRLNQGLMEQFREKCQQENVSMASVLERLLQDFIEG